MRRAGGNNYRARHRAYNYAPWLLLRRLSRRSGVAAIALITCLLAPLFAIASAASNPAISAPSTLTVLAGTTTSISGASISTGFAGNVRVTGSTTTGSITVDATSTDPACSGIAAVTTTLDRMQAGNGTLSGTTIGFEGSVASVNCALRTLRVTTTSSSTSSSGNISLWATRSGAAFDPSTGHYYEDIVGASTWSAAKTAAEARSFNGMTGYLVTMTSAAELAFINNKVKSTKSWLGATDTAAPINAAAGSTVYANDAAARGHWYWVTGPDAGTHFADQSSTTVGAVCTPASPVAFGGAYMNWYPGAPRICDASLKEYAQYLGTGQWDVVAAATTVSGYVVEYGGKGETPIEQVSATIPVTVAVAPGAITNLAAAAGDTQSSLTWTAGSDGGSPATETVQYLSGGTWTNLPTSGAGPIVSNITANGSAHSAVVTGLTNAQAVSLRVSVANAVATTNSNTVVTTPYPPPDAPVSLTATPGNRALGLNWTAPNLGGAPAITAYHLDVVGQPTLSRDIPATPTTYDLTGLANGTSYTVQLRAKNAIGLGAVSEVTATPRTVPSIPTNVDGTPTDRTVALTWSAPADAGGSPVTGYTVTPSPAEGSCVVTDTTASCTGLTNGTPYTFSVIATNASGNSLPGTNPSPITPRTIPNAPTTVVGTPKDGAVDLTWVAPVNNGGAAITSYTATASPADGSCAVTGTTAKCTGLTNGKPYTFTVIATNVAGDSVPSSASSSIIPRRAPDAPTSVIATPGNQEAALQWTAPADNGGSAITGYTATANPSDGPCVVTGTTALCTGLTNGRSYTFTVVATNVAGNSTASTASAPIIPRRVPDQPTAVVGTPGNQSVSLTWQTPASNGGSAITGYTATANPADGPCVVTGTTASCTGLTNGRSYSFTVVATNIAGDSLPSTASAPVVPRTIPDPPTTVLVGPADSSVTVEWTAPAWNGGSAVTGYIVTANPAAGSCAVTGTTATCTGLANGTPYTFTVIAKNAAGNSAPSVASASVTPRTIPQPATNVVGVPTDSTVSLTWDAPTNNGGSAITGYTATANPADGSCLVTGTTATCSGLTNGKAYTFTVIAENIAGNAAPSAASKAVVPRTVPDQPRYVSVNPGNQSATVTWVAPVFDGGSTITNYTVSAAPADGPCTIDGAFHATCTGLTNGYSYTFRVVATNVAGDSLPSELAIGSSTIPRTIPDAPTNVVGTPGDGSVSLTWAMPAYNGGAHIDGYRVTITPNAGSCVVTDTTAQCDGLTNGSSYTFRITAYNVAGDSLISDSSAPVIPRRIPDVATNLQVIPGNGKVDLTWAAPAFNGGSDITGYWVSASPAEGSCMAFGTTAQCSGLQNGHEYTFTVVATNVAGDSAPSDASAPVIPRTVPDAPTDVAVTPAGGEVDLTWNAPSWNGGSALTGYRIITSPAEGNCAITDTSAKCTGLTNGRTYTFTVIATNIAGDSAPSVSSANVTPRVVPDAPTSVVVAPHSESVSVSWTTPAFNGGATITGYTAVTTPADGSCEVTSATTAECSGLKNGDSYTVSVLATNEAGNSAFSAPSSSVVPRTVPDAPTSVLVTPANTEVGVTWTAPNWNGGSAITSYTVFTTPSAGTCTITDTLSATCAGLTNGTPYTVNVVATNIAGNSDASTPSDTVIPRTIPGAPTELQATPADRSVSLTWTAPVSDGGAAIDGYEVTPSPADGRCDVSGTSAVCSDLANGKLYQFTVLARNVAGASESSQPSNAVIPRTTPDSPTGVSVTPGNATINVTWVASAFNGGSDITAYTAKATPGGQTCQWVSGPLACTLSNLTNGTSYTVTVTATNVAGDSVDHATSSEVTPRTIPNAPTAVTATPSPGAATVTWTAPDNGGAEITGYKVTATPNGQTCSWTTGPLTCTVSGLTNGTAYTFTVTATNIAGDSQASDASSSVTPITVPGAPTNVAGTAGDASVTLTWTAPTDTGGSPITGYTVATDPDAGTCLVADLTATCSGLTNGTSYTFTVTTQNAVGQSVTGTTSASITPRTVAGAPSAVLGTPGNASVALSWTAPATNGGGDITGYEITTTPTAGTCAPNGATAATCSGLINGTAYSFTVKAVNAAGKSAASDPSAPVTPRNVPGAPTGVTAIPDNVAAAVSWTEPTDTGGSPITGYTVNTTPVGGTCDVVGTTANCTTLKNGTPYTFTVIATNEAGNSLPSVPSAVITPRTIPDPPTAVAGTPGAASVTVTWAAPVNTGGSPITAYTVTSSPAAGPCIVTALQATCNKLANGLPYTFTVKATNIAGDSLPSAVSAPVTPRTIPGAVSSLTGTLKDTTVTINWVPPALNGGAPIIDYKLETRNSADAPWAAQTVAGTSTTLSANPGDTVLARVSARNAAGFGPVIEMASPVVLPVPKVDPPIVIQAEQIIGGQIGNATVIITAKKLQPGSTIDAWAFSTQVKLFEDQTDAGGTYRTEVKIPAGLEPGEHTLLVRGVDQTGKKVEGRMGFKVADDGTVVALVKPNATIEPNPNAINAFNALNNPVALAATAVAAMSLVSVGAGGGGGHGGGEAEVKTELKIHEVGEVATEARWGDKYGIWRTPGTQWLDSAAIGLTIWMGPRFPLFTRFFTGSSPLRAMLGIVALMLPIVGIALGIYGGRSVDGQALPPSLGVMAAIMALGVFDAWAGVLAMLAYSCVVVFSGSVHEASQVRFLMGMMMLGAGPGMIAVYFRPYRRPKPVGTADWWERLCDFVVVPLVGAWATTHLVEALASFSQLELPIAEQNKTLGLVVGIALFLRVLLDHEAVKWYPQRLDRHTPKYGSSGTVQKVSAIVIKAVVFIFIAIAIIGNVWQLWVGLALLLIPYILGLWSNRLPKSTTIYHLVPDMVPKLFVELVLGTALIAALHMVMEPGPNFARWAFVIAALPAFVINTLKLFGRRPPGGNVWYMSERLTVFYRCACVVVFGALLFLMFFKPSAAPAETAHSNSETTHSCPSPAPTGQAPAGEAAACKPAEEGASAPAGEGASAPAGEGASAPAATGSGH